MSASWSLIVALGAFHGTTPVPNGPVCELPPALDLEIEPGPVLPVGCDALAQSPLCPLPADGQVGLFSSVPSPQPANLPGLADAWQEDGRRLDATRSAKSPAVYLEPIEPRPRHLV